MTEALVIGAGVSGLTTALCLAEGGHAVRIRTAALPRETTSRAAGAMRDAQILEHQVGLRPMRTSSASRRRRSARPGSCTTTATAARA